MRRWREAWQGFKTGAWLGWQIESNWTDPFLFAIYSVVKPVAGVLILVVMYLVVAKGGLSNPLFPQAFLGTTFYLYVVNVLSGVSFTVHDDREHYGMLKYVYIAPIHVYGYLLGRGVAKALVATLSVLVTLLFGASFLGVRVLFADPKLFALGFVLGLGALAFFGVLLAGVCLIIARHGWMVGEAVAGVLYVLCGAVFPLEVLPQAFRTLSLGLPPTYWFEALRRALLGRGLHAGLSFLSDSQILLILAGSTALGIGLSLWGFRLFEHIARRRGLLDMQTMY